MIGAPDKAFDELAGDYDRLLDDPLRQRFAGDNAFFIHQKCRALLRCLERVPASGRVPRILDVGCGQGTALRFLRPHARVFGCDVSQPMLAPAVHEAPVAVQEPFDLPFQTAAFDAAYAFCVYHHVPREAHVRHLRELARVVRPGGLVCVFEHNPLNPITRRVFQRAPIDRGCEMIPRRQLEEVFVGAGLQQVQHGYVLFAPEAIDRRIHLEPYLEWLPLGGQYYVSGRRG
jgi:SAM-dependent methyltransferase